MTHYLYAHDIRIFDYTGFTAPQRPRLAPISAAIHAEVLQYYDDHPHERSCRLIAARLRQAHDGQAVIGHSKAAEILRGAQPTQ